MANPYPFAILNHKNAGSGIPYVSLRQWDLVLGFRRDEEADRQALVAESAVQSLLTGLGPQEIGQAAQDPQSATAKLRHGSFSGSHRAAG